ncbi:MAG: hypothetical protein PQJ58_20530 [Spirochaetales bacterium]|nr:hypothetical protein [Spirochaetales bacterium]
MKNIERQQIEQILDMIMDIIIPAGESGEPPASGSRATGFLRNILETPDDTEELGLLLLKISGTEHLTEKALREVESENPPAFARLVALVYEAYYGDPEIVEKLGLPGPPQPGGHEMKPFDTELLKPVLSRSGK